MGAPHPLAAPLDGALLAAFARHFRLPGCGDARTRLRRLAAAFARLPYENLTKLIREAEAGRGPAARRSPAEVLADHFRYGAGGTCFSLTAALLHLVRSLGLPSEPILADRPYGPDTHCALLVWLEGQPHLIDPGYLLVDPVPLPAGEELRVRTAFNEVVLTPHPGGERIDLATIQEERRKHRLTFKTAPADAGQMLRAWDASFDWEMMRYPLLTRVTGARQLYLRGGRLQVRTSRQVQRLALPPETLPQQIAAQFGIDPRLAAKALAILKQRGETDGGD